MMHSYKFTLVILLFFIASSTFGQEKKLSLSEAIALGLQNSKQLKISLAGIESANAAVQEAKDRRLPDASFGGSYLILNKPTVNLKIKNPNSTGNETASPNQAMYAMANISLPIYNGKRIHYGIESAKFLEAAAKMDVENEKQNLVLNTVEAYTNLYKAANVRSMVNENLAAAKEREKELVSLEKNGIIPRNDLLKAQLQVANTELALMDADNNFKMANLNMNILLGLPDSTLLQTDLIQTNVKLENIDNYLSYSLQNRKDREALAFRHKAALTGIKAVKSEKYPGLALKAGYVALNVPGVLTVYNAVNLGLGIQYNLSGLWKNKSKIKQAETTATQLSLQESILSDAVRLEVNKAYQDVVSQQKKIEVYQRSIEQATENFRMVRNKYNNQLSTTSELLEADTAQLQARMNYSFAVADGVVAYNRLLLASGKL
jgi:outer membrane protein